MALLLASDRLGNKYPKEEGSDAFLLLLRKAVNLGYSFKLFFKFCWVSYVVRTFSGFNNLGLISLKCLRLM